MGFGSPSRYVPKSLPRVSRPRAPLLGFRRPFNARGGESPRPAPVARPGLPGGARGCASGSHPASYGAAPRFSQPLSGLFLSPPSRHFQTGGVRGVLPFRELILPRSPDDSSPPACPLDVSPIELRVVPVLGGDRSRALRPVPRSFRPESLIAYRAFVFVEIDLRRRSMINDPTTDLSLLGFCLLMV
jgi:hypothetical protein